MTLGVGSVVAERFRVESRAGVGGMGEVYRALDALTGRSVALKVLLSNDADHIARFEREAGLLSALSHPGIVAPVAQGQLPSGEPFLAMEWLSGQDLAARLRG